MMQIRRMLRPYLLVAVLLPQIAASDITLEQRLAPRIEEIIRWAASPILVNAVLAQNRLLPDRFDAMKQTRWAALDRLDPFVVSFTVNSAGKFLRTVRTQATSEAFLNDASGYKVAFIDKPTYWSHHGKPKHETPMTGKIWRGPIEMDESSGARQIQIAVPVLDHGKPVGSLVVGLNIFAVAAN